MEQPNASSWTTVFKTRTMGLFVFLLILLSLTAMKVNITFSNETLVFTENDHLANDIDSGSLSLESKFELLNLLKYKIRPSALGEDPNEELKIHDIIKAVQNKNRKYKEGGTIKDDLRRAQCDIRLVESIPEGLIYPNSSIPENPSTYSVFVELLEKAESTLELASSYWSLRGSDINHEDPTDWQGEDIFKRIHDIASSGNIKVKIAQDLPKKEMPNKDTEELSKIPGVEVRSLNFPSLMGGGILHTKMWLVDRRHFYVGSANFDWRSLTQVKEMGVVVFNCPTFAEDMAKIFDVYWDLGGEGKNVPDTWPSSLSTNINSENPLKIQNMASLNGKEELAAYLSSSPPPFCPKGRVTDKDAIVQIIDSAKRFVHIAVMDYYPITIYTREPKFWPVIDDALRRAAIERGIEIKLLLSNWTSTRPQMKDYLRSLTDLSRSSKTIDIQGKFFKVPSFSPAQKSIPFARVNHNKYIVTDKAALIGTSNWTPDYFLKTGGIGFIFSSKTKSSSGKLSGETAFQSRSNNDYLRGNEKSHSKSIYDERKDDMVISNMHTQLSNVFLRDWNSPYASRNL